MKRTTIRMALPVVAVLAVACNRPAQRADDSAAAGARTQDAAGTSGTSGEPVAVSGCVVRIEPDGYALTALVGAAAGAAAGVANPVARPGGAGRNARG